MIGLDGQLHHRPVVFCCDCADDLLQPIPYRPYQHLAAPLGTPNDVVDYQMDIVPLVLIIHSYSIPQNNTVCKDRGPFISRLKPGAFWPISVRFQFDSQRDLVGLGRALTLFRRVVDTAVIDSDGGLEVTFVDHTVLRVPSNPDFEYWNLDGPHGVLIVAGPGDRVSVFR